MLMIAPAIPASAEYDRANAQPMVMYRNLLAEGTLTDGSLPAAAPRANAVTQSTNDFWKPASVPESLRSALSSYESADAAFFAAHDMFTKGSRVSVQYKEANRTNVFLRSQEFDNASWPKSAATVTANATTAPDGTLTADKLVEDATNAGHFISQSFVPTRFRNHIFSVYAKAAERQFLQLIFTNDAFGSNLVGVFDLINGQCLSGSAALICQIQAVGDGWYRCSVSAVCSVFDTSTAPQIRLSNSFTAAAVSYAGDGVSGLFIWGAQMEGDNLIPFSSEFDNAAWGKSAVTVSANAGTAPDGTLTADKIIPTTANVNHLVALSLIPIFNGKTYAFSVYAKADGYNWVRIGPGGTTVNPTWVFVDLTTGAVGLTSTNVRNVVVTNIGTGWWHVSYEVTAIASGTVAIGIYPVNANSFTTFAGDGVSGIQVWNVQMQEIRNRPTSHIPTTTVAVASDWHDTISWYAPESDHPFCLIWAPVVANSWGVLIHNAVAQIGVAWVGPRFIIEGGVSPGYEPVWSNRTVKKLGGGTRKAHWLGQRVESVTAELQVDFTPQRYEFVANDLAPFLSHFEQGLAFVWASAPSYFEKDVAYCWAEDEQRIEIGLLAGGDLCSMSMRMVAYAEI